VTIIDLNHIWY